ncbi:MAG: ABC transporter permease [Chloroflexi bacterium]|nr:ABC transporter permease [Chloroflexota bacterium]
MRFLGYAIRRLLWVIPVLLGVTLITFLLTRVLPGNPIDRVAGPFASAEQKAEMMREARLDLPVIQQFSLYVRDLVVHGDLGVSYSTARPVAQDLWERLPISLELTTLGMLLAIVLALPLGIASAVAKDTWVDQLGRVVSVIGVSMPIFWLGLILLQVFFVKLGVAPAPLGRLATSLIEPERITGWLLIDSALVGDWAVFRSAAAHLALPVVIVAFTALAPLARMTRSSMIDALESDYIRTARALGLPTRVIIFQHALKNALIPILTMIAGVFGYALGGEVLVELVFAWPGLGTYSYNAILASDFPAIQGFILLITLFYVLIYLVVDLLIAAIDPRVEYA